MLSSASAGASGVDHTGQSSYSVSGSGTATGAATRVFLQLGTSASAAGAVGFGPDLPDVDDSFRLDVHVDAS